MESLFKLEMGKMWHNPTTMAATRSISGHVVASFSVHGDFSLLLEDATTSECGVEGKNIHGLVQENPGTLFFMHAKLYDDDWGDTKQFIVSGTPFCHLGQDCHYRTVHTMSKEVKPGMWVVHEDQIENPDFKFKINDKALHEVNVITERKGDEYPGYDAIKLWVPSPCRLAAEPGAQPPCRKRAAIE